MYTAEQYMEVVGREIYVSNNLKYTLQQGDIMSEKIEISLPRYYDGVDLDSKQVTLYVKTPSSQVLQVPLDNDKTVEIDDIVYNFWVTDEMTVESGWLCIVIVAIDQLGYRWSTKQVENAIYVRASC